MLQQFSAKIPCPKCGAEVPIRKKVCPSCGALVRPIGRAGKTIVLVLVAAMLAAVAYALVVGPA
jgi:predicted RNA-binding Zn-ribbon protein involved in translation (DUF1610 family)